MQRSTFLGLVVVSVRRASCACCCGVRAVVDSMLSVRGLDLEKDKLLRYKTKKRKKLVRHVTSSRPCWRTTRNEDDDADFVGQALLEAKKGKQESESKEQGDNSCKLCGYGYSLLEDSVGPCWRHQAERGKMVQRGGKRFL